MVTESKTTGQYERVMESVFRVIETVERMETPRGYRLWMLIPTHDGGVVPVFVYLSPTLPCQGRENVNQEM